MTVRREIIRGALFLASCLLFFSGGAALGAVNWLPFGPDGGDARRIVADPTDHQHLYLGTANGWIYESRNDGANWRRLSRVDKRDDLVLDSIVVDAENPKHLTVGAWVIDRVDGGLYISYDSGKTWISQAEMRGESVRALRASPTDANVLVAGTLKGVFRSTDGGKRWALISPRDSTEIHEVQSVAIDPVDSNVIYAGTWHLPWKTVDGGEHWENIKEGIIDDSDVFSILVDPGNPQVVYASACSGIYKSEDAARLFHKVQGIPSSARRTRVLMQDPSNLKVVFAGTTEGLFRSEDAGKNWVRTTGREIIVNDVLVDQTDSKRVMIATNRGGVLASDDGGNTFHASNSGFSARQITTVRHDSGRPATVLVGVVNDKEWGGIFRSDDGGLSWMQRAAGLQGRDVFALGQAPDGTFIAGTAHGLFRWDEAGATWIKVQNAPTGAKETEGSRLSVMKVRAPVPFVRNQFAAKYGSHRVSAGSITLKHGSGARSPSHGVAASKRPVRKAVVAKHKLATGRAKSVGQGSTAQGGTGVHPLVPRIRVSAGLESVPSGEAPAMDDAAAGLAKEQVSRASKGFDGGVFGLTTAGGRMCAITSVGLMGSDDNGLSWTLDGPEHSAEWRYLASAQDDVVSASLHTISFSADDGRSWTPVLMPEGLTQIGALSVEASGRIWVGGREGVFISSDAGHTWSTPKNLFVNMVNSIYYDEPTKRMIVTTAGYNGIVFVVQLPDLRVTFTDTGWTLRFAQPIGDHLLAATLYDGIVIEPKMVESPMGGGATETRVPEAPSSPRSPLTSTPAAGTGGVPVVEPVHLPNSLR